MKNNGFTLIELLGVIVILTILSLITIPIIDVSLNRGKEGLSDTQRNQIIKALKDYYEENFDELNGVSDDENNPTCKDANFLQDRGYLPADIKDPKTNKRLDKVCIWKICAHDLIEKSDGTKACEVDDGQYAVHWKYKYSVMFEGETILPITEAASGEE